MAVITTKTNTTKVICIVSFLVGQTTFFASVIASPKKPNAFFPCGVVEKIKIAATSTIKKALSIIDSGAVKIALVMDIDNKLLGTLGDGDIRR